MIETGWLRDPQAEPYWNELCAMLKPAADRGGCAVFEPGDLMWIATEDSLIIGAATTRLTVAGAELKHVAGVRAREWYPDLEWKICGWAKLSGASVIVSRGRRGWIPWVAKLGWQVVGREGDHTLFEKAL